VLWCVLLLLSLLLAWLALVVAVVGATAVECTVLESRSCSIEWSPIRLAERRSSDNIMGCIWERSRSIGGIRAHRWYKEHGQMNTKLIAKRKNVP